MIILIGSKTNKQSQPQLPSSRDDINGIRNQFCGRPPSTLNPPISGMFSAVACLGLEMSSRLQLQQQHGVMLLYEGHLYSTRVQDELSDVDQNQFGFIDQNKFEYSLLATG